MAIAISIGALAFFIFIIVWTVRYTKKVNQRKIEYFKDFSDKNGLTHTQSKYMMVMLNNCEGKIGDFDIKVYEQMVGSGKNKTVMTHCKISNSGIDFQFKIGKEHIFSKAGKMLGMRDIEFRDEKFDKKFLLKSENESAFRQLMDSTTQQKLKDLEKDMVSAIRNQPPELSYAHYGPLVKENQFQSFERVVGFMLYLCEKRNR